MTILEPIRAFLTSYDGRQITLEQVVARIGRPRRPVLRMLDQLAKEGYLTESSDQLVAPGPGEFGRFRRNPTWRINQKQKISNRPRIKGRPRNLRDKIWMVIRAKRRFTRSNLVILAGCSLATTEVFTLLLERHSYIRRIGKADGEILWLLINDCGPQRPKLPEVAT